ncbi:suppressor of cytokine signaling 7-like [Littorina saxatilis]|uniref:Cytokine-inducible SH2-containing protein n=1 Tax=Littorina saxatilis TaxID=31220 RepID=A0AAN9BTD2_9CAEN
MVCQSTEAETLTYLLPNPLRNYSPQTHQYKSGAEPQNVRTTKNGSSQQKMPQSSINSHTATQPNVYSSFPTTTSFSSRNSAVSRNDVFTGSSAGSISPRFTHQEQLRVILPSFAPPSPTSSTDEGFRRAVPAASRDTLLQLQPPPRRLSLTPPSPVSLSSPPRQRSILQLQSQSSRRSQSWSSDNSLETDLTAVMPFPGQGGSHSTPCSPTFQSAASNKDYLYLYNHLPRITSDTDYERLGRSMHGLCEGCFYYKDLDSDSARILLQNAPEGTFIVRDSSDPKFLFALTVKTARGATSVRIQYHHGFFQLDCEDQMKRKLPRFETMLDLLNFHVTMCQDKQGSQYRWLEASRKKDMVVRLSTPRRHAPPSLSHLARVTVNRNLEDLHLPSRSTDLLPLPNSMKSYLRAYPYKV